MTSTPRRGTGPTRRGFLKSSAAVTAPLILAGTSKAAPASDSDALKIGLVGCGGRGTGAAMQALSAEEGTVVITALADFFPDKVEACRNNLINALGEERQDRMQVDDGHLFSGFDGYRKLIDSGVDVVLLATPPYFRPEHLEAAINAEKHVFCEKPMAVDAPGVRRVIAAAKKAKELDLSLVSGFCWRRNALMRQLTEELLGGRMGAIRALHTTYNTGPLRYQKRKEGWTEMEWHMRNWQQTDFLSGDHIVEQAIHSLDMMSWAMGDAPPLRVTAVGGRQARHGEGSGNIYDHFGATFDYADGVKGFHQSRQISQCSGENKAYYWGELGWADVNPWDGEHRINGETPWTRFKTSPVDGRHTAQMYQQEHDELFASIRDGVPLNDGEWMTLSTMLGIMVRMSAYTGQTVTYDMAMNSQEVLGPQDITAADYTLAPVPIPGQTKFL